MGLPPISIVSTNEKFKKGVVMIFGHYMVFSVTYFISERPTIDASMSQSFTSTNCQYDSIRQQHELFKCNIICVMTTGETHLDARNDVFCVLDQWNDIIIKHTNEKCHLFTFCYSNPKVSVGYNLSQLVDRCVTYAYTSWHYWTSSCQDINAHT